MRSLLSLRELPALLVCALFVASLRDTPTPELLLGPLGEGAPAVRSFTRDGLLEVRVGDAAHAPLAGASVRGYWMHDETAYLAAAGTTDSQGRVAWKGLPRGVFWITAEKAALSRSSSTLVVEKEARSVDLQLGPEHVLSIQVADEDQAPLAEATAQAQAGDPLPIAARANEEGRITIGRLGPPPWKLSVGATGFESVSQWIREEGTEPLRISLRKLGGFAVRVLDEAGRPAPLATVLAVGAGLWPARQMRADAQGNALLANLARGTYDLRAVQGDSVSEVTSGLTLGRGETKDATLVLQQGRSVSARVVEGDTQTGRPIAGAALVVAEGGLSSFPIEGRTGDKGTVRLGPFLGNASLSASAEGFVARPFVPIPSGARPQMILALDRAGTLMGVVRDAQGYPVGGATVELIGTDREGQPIDDNPDLSSFRSAHFAFALGGPRELLPVGELGVTRGPLPRVPHGPVFLPLPPRVPGFQPSASSTAVPPIQAPPSRWITRQDGTFRASPVSPGEIRALVHHPDYVEALSELVHFTAGEQASVQITLHGGGRLEGHVVDDRGVPVRRASITVAPLRGGAPRTTTTAEDGSFAFAAVAPELALSVAPAEQRDTLALRTTVLVAEGERKQLELTLPAPRGPLALRVVDERGRPLPAVQISATSVKPDAPLRRTLFTNKDGAAELPGSQGLPLRLDLSLPGRASLLVEVRDAPKDLELTLAPGLLVEGRVTARDGRESLAGAEVSLRTPLGTRRTLADKEGAFRFSDCPLGKAIVSAQREGFAPASREVSIEGTGDRALTLPAIDLREGGTVEGEVVDERGESVAGARVAMGLVPTRVAQGKRPSQVAVTDAHGAFVLHDLPAASVSLEARSDRARGKSAVIDVASGHTTDRVRIVLDQLVREDASPRGAGVAITVDPEATPVTILSVAPASEAELRGLLPGDVLEAIDGADIVSPAEATARLWGPLGSDVVVRIHRADGVHSVRLAREKLAR